MGGRSRLALIVGLTYQLVKWWHSHEAPFDDHIYTMVNTGKADVFLDLQYWHQRWRHCNIFLDCLGWIGAIGWPLGAIVALA